MANTKQKEPRQSVQAFMTERGLFAVAPQEALEALHKAGFTDVTSGHVYVARNAAKKKGQRVERPARVVSEKPAPKPAPLAKVKRGFRAMRERASAPEKPAPRPTAPAVPPARRRSDAWLPPVVRDLSPEERDFVRLGLHLGVRRTQQLAQCVEKLLHALYGEKAA